MGNIAPHSAEGAGPSEPPLPQVDVSPFQLRVLRAARDTGDEATIPHLAELLGGHPNTTRSHLESLVASGHIRRDTAPPAGRGRPRHVYRVTEIGKSALRPPPIAPEYAALASALAGYLAQVSPDPATDAQAAGRAWAERTETPGQYSDRTALLMERLSAMGFQPNQRKREDATDIVLPVCPLLAAASENPEVICNVHLGLMQGIMERNSLPSDNVSLLPFADDDGCIFRLKKSAG
ncbi:helix-turn-helix transcriptional regulator [Bowdeniella nasicola]|uniref:helix-turn-helix transcriptional regulator n=1 Tax=Bowdeniella nasicola TaxID=208480 RepID=UPI0011611881|nr:transcriptional regulator [Bowdeniella nasicola]